MADGPDWAFGGDPLEGLAELIRFAVVNARVAT